MTDDVYLISAKRSAVAPRNGAFKALQAHELGAPVITDILRETEISKTDIDQVILGNALYGGGNPARMTALLAGLPDSCPALTLDSQCCSGLDSINIAQAAIAAGQADVVLAGGIESYSRSPKRFKRALSESEEDIEYQRPPFSPFPATDPDMLEAAAQLSKTQSVSRAAQEAFAINSHEKAILGKDKRAQEIVEIAGCSEDAFTRNLTPKLCEKLPILAGDAATGLTSTTVAVEADAAAMLLLVSQSYLDVNPNLKSNAIRFHSFQNLGCSPATPPLAPIDATKVLLAKQKLSLKDITVVEIMEAFAVQAMAFIDAFNFGPKTVNRSGGALARGHPIGASGAINAVRLWHELQKEATGSLGLAAIAAAGGLGSAMILEKP